LNIYSIYRSLERELDALILQILLIYVDESNAKRKVVCIYENDRVYECIAHMSNPLICWPRLRFEGMFVETKRDFR